VDQIQFTMSGKTLQLNRQKVIEKLRPVKPEAIQTWAVEIEGKRFPVKQALSQVTGVRPAEFITHRARDIFERLGFTVVNVTRQLEPKPHRGAPGAKVMGPPGPGHTGEPDRIRLQALQLAMAFMSHRTQASPDAVLEAAAKFETWLRGDGQSPPPQV
jgi:hypothetical protein